MHTRDNIAITKVRRVKMKNCDGVISANNVHYRHIPAAAIINTITIVYPVVAMQRDSAVMRTLL